MWAEGEEIVQRFNRSYTPRDAGAIKAFNKTIKSMLITGQLAFSNQSLSSVLVASMQSYNTEQVHSSPIFFLLSCISLELKRIT